MDREVEAQFRVIRQRMNQYEKDSRQLIRVTESVKVLGKKVDRFSLAVTGFAITVATDIIAHFIK